MKLKLAKREDGWWITGLPDPSCPESGPYDRKADADDDRRGLERFYVANPEYAGPGQRTLPNLNLGAE